MYSRCESDRKKLKNERYTIKDVSMVNIDLPPILYINEILGTKLYRVVNGKIHGRRTWEIVHTLCLIVFVFVVNFTFLRILFEWNTNLTVSLILFGLVLIVGVTNNVFYIKKLYVDFQLIIRLHKNFDWIKSELGFEPKSFMVFNFIMEFSYIIIFLLIVYNDHDYKRFYDYFFFYRVDMSSISFVIWIFVIRYRLKYLNHILCTVYKLKLTNHIDILRFPDETFNKAFESSNNFNIDKLHKVYLKLRENLDLINWLYRFEVCLLSDIQI